MKPRRKNFSEEELKRMTELESQGRTRKQISEVMNCTQSAVTRRLGAVRAYRGLRLKVS